MKRTSILATALTLGLSGCANYDDSQQAPSLEKKVFQEAENTQIANALPVLKKPRKKVSVSSKNQNTLKKKSFETTKLYGSLDLLRQAKVRIPSYENGVLVGQSHPYAVMHEYATSLERYAAFGIVPMQTRRLDTAREALQVLSAIEQNERLVWSEELGKKEAARYARSMVQPAMKHFANYLRTQK